MRIDVVEISNYRAHLDTRVELNPLTMLIGRNGSGKSSIIYAIQNFFEPAAVVSVHDFYDTELPIQIRLTFSGLRPEEVHGFGSYVRDGTLVVNKRILPGEKGFRQLYFGTLPRCPAFKSVREQTAANPKKDAFNALVGTLDGLNERARTGPDVDRLMEAYEAEHPEALELMECEAQFFGAVGGGKLDNLTKFILVPAVRDPVSEVTKRGAIDQLVSTLVARQVMEREEVRDFKQRFEAEARTIFCAENLTELADLAADVTTLLEEFAPGSRLNLTWSDPAVPEVPLPATNATLDEEGHECPIPQKGHGLQRALVFSLLRYMAATSPNAGNGEVPVAGPDIIFAIEEPELYLHPSRARFLSDVLRCLATADGDARNQILFATHSPLFVEMRQFDSIRCVAKRDADILGRPPCCVIGGYSIDEAAAELARVSGRSRDEFTAESFMARVSPIMTSLVNEGFFANKVLVVEGLSEVGAIWQLQDQLGKSWLEKGIVIVPAGGKNSIDRPVVIFRGFGIPTYFLFDADKGDRPETNCLLMRLGGVSPCESPPTTVSSHWAALADDLEAELEAATGGSFVSLRDEVAAELGYSKPGDALKNVDGSALFISKAYAAGHTVRVLEEIVDVVTRL